MDAEDRIAENLLLRMVSHRDTLRHSHATRDIAYMLAIESGCDHRLAGAIGRAALLHDIGKRDIPCELLDAPRPLTTQETDTMRTHARIGEDIARKAGIPTEICGWIRLHHERADGSGYEGVPGDLIPMPARILIVADVWEASGALRPYNEYRSRDERWTILEALGFPEPVRVLRRMLEKSEQSIARVS